MGIISKLMRSGFCHEQTRSLWNVKDSGFFSPLLKWSCLGQTVLLQLTVKRPKKAHNSSDLKALIQPVFEFSYPKEYVESSFYSLISPNRFCDDMHVVA